MVEVSIIVPLHNAKGYVEKCLTSLLAQSFTDFEVLVVDDASTDGSLIAIEKISTDPRVKIFRNSKNIGAAGARNVGIEHANGRYIAFCDSDDIWFPKKLELQLSALNTQHAAASHTSVFYVSGDEKTLKQARPVVSWSDMKVRNWIANSSGLYDTSKVSKIFQSQLRHEDYEMWCAILRSGGASVGIDEPLVEINRRNDSLSGNKFKSIWWHFKAQRKIFGMRAPEIAFRFVQNIAVRIIVKLRS